MGKKSSLRSLWAIFLTFGIDNLSATIVFPILAPLFLGESHTIISTDLHTTTKTILLGVFLAAFPLGQFLFSPVIGELADRIGRKKTLIWTIFLGVIAYMLSGIGIVTHHLTILFVGRFIGGVAAGNMSVCLASIVDLSDTDAKKVRYFSYGSIIAGFTFVLGPFVGGKLSDPSIYPLFTPAFPMWIGSILALLNLVVIFLIYKETLHETASGRFDVFKAFHNVQLALRTRGIRELYLIYFFYLFSWNMIFQFMPAVMVETFSSTNSVIGDASALMGIVWIVGTILINWIAHFFSSVKSLLLPSLTVFAFAACFISVPRELIFFLGIVAITVFFAGGIWPLLTGSISSAAEPGIQGKILGLSQSIQSLSMMIAPIVGGLFIHAHSGIPFIISAISALLAAGLLTKADLPGSTTP